MKKPLRLPAALAFAVLGSAAVIGLTPSCSHDHAPRADASIDAGECALFCIPDGTDAGVVCDSCADSMGNCPAGCRPVG